MGDLLTLHEAADRLGVSARRARAMVASGQLPAEKRGRQWFVDTKVLAQVQHNRVSKPRRPLSAPAAWERIAALGQADGLLVARGRSLDELRRVLRRRAKHRSLYVHPGVVENLRERPGVVLGGREAAVQAKVPVDPGDGLDVYVRASEAEDLFQSVAARDAVEGANVIAHIVPDHAWPFHVGQRYAEPWVAWLDLEDRQDRAADTVLDRLVGGRPRA